MPESIFTPTELDNLKRRAHVAAFRPCLERLRREADTFAAMRLSVPDLPGGYYHDYICPEHGVELRFNPHRPREHRCPVDEAAFTGEKFDSAWRWFVNHHLAESTLRLAVLWRAEGGEAHRESVRQVFLGYAARYEFYRSYPRTGNNPGVATYTTLDESVWIIPLAWAFSLIADTLTADESDQIVSRLLVPAAEHLVARRYGAIHNFTCWHNAAIATIGRVAGRADLVRFAIEGEKGQRAQLREGMLADGLWFEGSMSYHFYSVWAILMSMLAARFDRNTDISSIPVVAKSLLAPIRCAHPDGTLPATNDCWYFTSILGPCCHGVPPAPDFYEIAFARYGEPAFAGTLHRAYRTTPRDSIFALLFGAEELPPAPQLPAESVDLPESGLAILRPAAGIELLLKYGPHGGYHGHPDKLALTGWAHGWRFSPDLGTPGYGVAALETWYRQSLSHNTVVIDGESQLPAQGLLERFERNRVVATVAWPGVKYRRSIHARPGYLVDVFEVECVESHCIDLIYHNAGTIGTNCPVRSVPAITGGVAYQHLSGLAECEASGPLQLQWRDGVFGMMLWIPGVSGERVYTGRSPANPPSTRHGFVLRRRRGERAVFVSVFHLYRETPSVVKVVFEPEGGFEVHTAGDAERWTAQQLTGAT